MTWSIKTVKLDMEKSTLTWNGLDWVTVIDGIYDHVINFNRDIPSTWRQVEYTDPSVVMTNREDVSVERFIVANDARYLFFNPLTENVDIILTTPPVPGIRYFLKNLTSTVDKYKLRIKETSGGTDILVLDEVFTTAFLTNDGIQWQGVFG